jgi:hypothetical protein
MGTSKIAKAVVVFLGIQFFGLSQALPSPLPKHQTNSATEVCAWRAAQNVDAEYTWRSSNILELSQLDPTIWKMLNLFFLEIYDVYGLKTPASLEEMQRLFMPPSIHADDGDQLFIKFFQSLKGGDEFLEIQSFPGGNEFGLIFNLETSQLVGRSEDTEMLVQTSVGSKWSVCPEN